MTHVGYLVAAYSITVGVIAAYAAWIVVRSRALARVVDAPDVGGQRPAIDRAGPDR